MNVQRRSQLFDVKDMVISPPLLPKAFVNSKVADQQPSQASAEMAENDVTTVVVPFKDQDSANLVKT